MQRKSGKLEEQELENEDQLPQAYPRSRWGLKKSKPSHNPEGLLEKELRLRENLDKGFQHKYRKRHRTELSVNEIEEIVATTKEPHRHQVDVAKQYRVSKSLVHKLVKEAKLNPEKLIAKQQKVQLDKQKQEAILNTTSKMLEINKPITSARLVREDVEEQTNL